MHLTEVKNKKDLVKYIKENYKFLKELIEDNEEITLATNRTGYVVYIKRTGNLVFYNNYKVEGVINSVSEKKLKQLLMGA